MSISPSVPSRWKHLRTAPLRTADRAGLDLGQLARTGLLILLATAWCLLKTWTRVDLRESAAALGRAESAYAAARKEHARLELELATLSSPHRLEAVSSQLQLDPNVPVVDVPATP